ncbi:MAG: helix-turn-helix domain-containing protein [Kiritimatiellia bacterium]
MKNGEKITPEIFHLGYFISPPGGAFEPATTKPGECRFELVTRGRVEHPERKEWMGPGWICFHRPGQQTIFLSPEQEHYECLTAVFRLPDDAPDFPRAFLWPDEEEVERFSREMLYLFYHEGIELSVLGSLIWAQFVFRNALDKVPQRRQRVPPRIAAVIEKMSQRPDYPHSVASLAAEVGLSASHLHADFKAATGKTPHQMLLQYRLSAARHRLVTTTDPVKAIAVDSGFSTTENFCRTFKKHTGISAAAFRRKYMLYR